MEVTQAFREIKTDNNEGRNSIREIKSLQCLVNMLKLEVQIFVEKKNTIYSGRLFKVGVTHFFNTIFNWMNSKFSICSIFDLPLLLIMSVYFNIIITGLIMILFYKIETKKRRQWRGVRKRLKLKKGFSTLRNFFILLTQ